MDVRQGRGAAAKVPLLRIHRIFLLKSQFANSKINGPFGL